MAKTITMIPATKNKFTAELINSRAKRRTAGYARVSTDNEEQLTSYEAQVDYYTNYIKSRDDWEFVDVYTDEGISATNTKHRNGFNQMISDALSGKIDLIVTKSVSRFARNTVDSLVTVRKLKEKGVEVYFEKENIYTLDSKGELLITIMSSLAQEESRSISENITWGQRKRFSDGKVNMPYKRFLGYEKGEDGLPKIIESEAETVRLIYKLYLNGKTPAGICKELEALNIPTPGKKYKWSQTTVESILKNEKYKGDALLQKSFTVDFLTKTKKVNEGEVPQYYVKNSHPAIIEPLEFDMVQAEIARRKRIGNYYSGNSAFSSKLICGDCGCFYGQKVWHSNDAYKRIIWQCNGKFKKEMKCTTPHLSPEQIQQAFIQAYNIMMSDRETVIADCELMRSAICDCTQIETEIVKQKDEVDIIADFVKKCIQENATSAQSQEEYAKRYENLVKRYEKAKKKYDALVAEKIQRIEHGKQLQIFIDELRNQPLLLDTWDERLWTSLVEKGTVNADGSIEIEFKNNKRIMVES